MSKIVKPNFYGFYHAKVCKAYQLTKFLNEFTVLKEYWPVAVYLREPTSKYPNPYFLLQIDQEISDLDSGFIRGMRPEDIEPFRLHNGLQCLKCGDVIYSLYRRWEQTCSCKTCRIDGGREYFKVSGAYDEFEAVQIDLLTDEVSKVNVIRNKSKKVD